MSGAVTDASVDLDGQIVDPTFAKRALSEWFDEFANVRQMHSGGLPPAGVGVDFDPDRKGGPWLKSEVYEPGAMLQVRKKGYKAYSIGIAQPRLRRDAMAPNGRIIDGKVVEVSLVDYPANPNTKFVLSTKRAGNPSAPMQIPYEEVTFDSPEWLRVVKELKACGMCKGTKEIGGARCPACKGTGEMAPDVVKETLSAGARDKIPGSDFGYTDSQGEGHFPLHDKEHVQSAMGRFGQHDFETPKDKKQTAQRIVSRARGHGMDVDPTSAVAQAAGKNIVKEVSTTLTKAQRTAQAAQRLHDWLCPAYSVESVGKAYPKLPAELSAVLGKRRKPLTKARNALHEQFNELNKDILATAGPPIPAAATPTQGFSTAASALGTAASTAGGPVGPGVLTSSPPVPNASGSDGSVTPSKYKRPYLSAGHQRETGEGQSASSTGLKGVTASQFDRGDGQVDGVARPSPSNSKRGPMGLAEQLHDSLMIAFPNVGCCMEPPTPGAAPKGVVAKVIKAIQQPTVKKSKTVKPAAKKGKPFPGAAMPFGKPKKKAKGGNGNGSAPGNASDADNDGDADADGKSATRKLILKARRQAEKASRRTVRKQGKAFKSQLATLTKSVRDLSGQPDPSRSPARREPLRSDTASQAQKSAEAVVTKRRADHRAALERQAIQASDPGTRLRAQQELRKLDKAAEATITK